MLKLRFHIISELSVYCNRRCLKKGAVGIMEKGFVTGIKRWYLIIAFYITNNEKDVE